uniref:Autophagy-related protein 101 n=1 Tax=Kwoniella bestiolae CBS 10118 TaxID=1296100 RepID=A0A1B9FWV1_9TREE|nr:hypothetical protein I302_07600 [Kwoniella bestiolae CBS 10118]OCF23246.1 hypothetical protein I302_07600 [Kwoniella bestiolae CBS 10118]
MEMDTVNHIELTIHPSQVRPTLRALLYAIFFHRNLDACEPEDFELLDSHIAISPNSTIEREVNTRIEEFAREYLEEGRKTFGEIAVVFLQKKPKKGWFAITEELIPWEEHLITLHFDRSSTSNNPLHTALIQILTFCAEKKGNVPPLVGSSILISPPSPTELFSPSPPTYPARLTSPPPQPLTNTTPATATARDITSALPSGGDAIIGSTRRGVSPATGFGYLEQAKDGLRAVGAGVGWGGRAIGGAFGRGGG